MEPEDSAVERSAEQLAAVAATGDRLATLKLLRDHIALSFKDISPGVLPQLTKQFTDLLAQIAELEPPVRRESAIDDFQSGIQAAIRNGGGDPIEAEN
ncbi:hypothetical protein [Nocardia brasiliensis]|uniref:hypothetical protein n=1 Tax=Nocardia brasiliensis TaxID=37326 RepID=UPI002458F37F|nr:hypothetical protein [Nocardia brasiliensis]